MVDIDSRAALQGFCKAMWNRLCYAYKKRFQMCFCVVGLTETTPVPEVNRSMLYYVHTHSMEGKDAEDAADVMLLSHHSSSCEADDDIDTESNNSDSFFSDGFRSATSHVTHSSDSTSVSRHFPAT